MSRKGICRLSDFRFAVAAPALPLATEAAAPFAPPLAGGCGFLLEGGVDVSSSSSSLSEPELLELEPDDDELVSELELLDEVDAGFFSSLRLAAVGIGAVALADALVGRSSGVGAGVVAGAAAAASAGLLMPLLMCSAAFLAACRWGTYARMSSMASSFEVGFSDAIGFSFSTSIGVAATTLSFSFVGGTFSRSLEFSFSTTGVTDAAVGLVASG